MVPVLRKIDHILVDFCTKSFGTHGARLPCPLRTTRWQHIHAAMLLHYLVQQIWWPTQDHLHLLRQEWPYHPPPYEHDPAIIILIGIAWPRSLLSSRWSPAAQTCPPSARMYPHILERRLHPRARWGCQGAHWSVSHILFSISRSSKRRALLRYFSDDRTFYEVENLARIHVEKLYVKQEFKEAFYFKEETRRMNQSSFSQEMKATPMLKRFTSPKFK